MELDLLNGNMHSHKNLNRPVLSKKKKNLNRPVPTEP